MDVILLETVRNLGIIGTQVRVKPGYARNYLVPQGKAMVANEENLKLFEARRAEIERQAAAEREAAEARARALQGREVVLERRAGRAGRLFGSVGPADVATALSTDGPEVLRSEIRMPEGPIRQVGSYRVVVHVYPEVDAEVTVTVQPEGGVLEGVEEAAEPEPAPRGEGQAAGPGAEAGEPIGDESGIGDPGSGEGEGESARP